MVRMRLVLLGLMAVLAVSAVASASAFAAPEFSTTAKFIGTQKGTSTLENTGAEKIECTAGSSPGVIENKTETGAIVVKFNKCKSSVGACKTSGASPEEIRTNTLMGELGETEKVVVEGLLPATGTTEASFTCGSGLTEAEITVKGGVICEIGPTMKPSTTSKLTCTEKTGKQTYTAFDSSTTGANTTLELLEERKDALGTSTSKSGEEAEAILENEGGVKVEIT
jgi:hypothetical protein